MRRMFWLVAVLLGSCLLQGCGVTVGSRNLSVAYDGKEASVELHDHPAALYRFDDVPFKPYVKELHTPGGVNVLRDAPADHLHHHALMFALAVDGVDFWAETPECGRQVHRGMASAADVNAGSGTFFQQLDWTTPAGQVLLQEQRTIQTQHIQDATVLTWWSQLTLPQGKTSAKVTGSHYFGLGARFVESMDKAGSFLYASGEAGPIVRGDERLTPGPWCAYHSIADGKKVTVVMFDHPSNPREAAWFTMQTPFAYLSATLRLHEKPLQVGPDRPLKVCYAVAVFDGHADGARIRRLYDEWRRTAGGS